MVERLICIQEVLGSNPCISTTGENTRILLRAQRITSDATEDKSSLTLASICKHIRSLFHESVYLHLPYWIVAQ